MQELIDPKAEAFAADHSTPEQEILLDIARYTRQHHPQPHMLSGHLQGKFLEMVSRMIRPDRILEIGTFTGYSAVCLAAGLSQNGILHTIELREEEAGVAAGFFEKAGLSDRIRLHTGNAAEIIPTLNETWDLIFIDADKTGYQAYFNLVFPQLRKNGFILADNIFFHGEALEPEPRGKNGKAMAEFSRMIRGRNDVDKMILTLRDGLYLIRKT